MTGRLTPLRRANSECSACGRATIASFRASSLAGSALTRCDHVSIEFVAEVLFGDSLRQRQEKQPPKPCVVRHVEPSAVNCQELDHGERARALVAVHESMIFGDADAETNRERQKVALAVVVIQLLGTMNGACDQAVVPNALRTSVTGDLIFVDR